MTSPGTWESARARFGTGDSVVSALLGHVDPGNPLLKRQATSGGELVVPVWGALDDRNRLGVSRVYRKFSIIIRSAVVRARFVNRNVFRSGETAKSA